MKAKPIPYVALLLLIAGVLGACGEKSVPADKIERPAPPGGAAPTTGRPGAPAAPDQ